MRCIFPISHDLPPQNQNFQSSCAFRIRGKQKPPVRSASLLLSAGPFNPDRFLKCVRNGAPVPQGLQTCISPRYPRYAAALGQQFVYSSITREILLPNINWGHTPKNFPAMTAMIEFISNGEWYLPNVDDGSRMSWVELVCDLLSKHGFIGGFLTPQMPMSHLTRKMKTYTTKIMQSCGVNLITVPKIKIHREFLGGDVAGFVGRKTVCRPELSWAVFLTDQSRYVNGSTQANAHWVPNFSALFP